jgi:hypothetical protein
MTREEVFAMCPALPDLEQKLDRIEGKSRMELSDDGSKKNPGCLTVLDADEQLERADVIDLEVVPVDGEKHACHVNSSLRFEADTWLTFATGEAFGDRWPLVSFLMYRTTSQTTDVEERSARTPPRYRPIAFTARSVSSSSDCPVTRIVGNSGT